MKYNVSKPYLNGNELKYVTEAVKDGWLSWSGPFVKEAEEAWAKYCGTKYAVATSSGTTALTLALAAIGLKPGDEVIVPEFTMVATAFAVSYHGATPVFVDCGEKDLNIDVSKIEAAITPKTKAIIPVHIYGRMANMEKIMELAHDYNLYVIEDACEAHGAFIKGKKSGAWGDLGCFSLFANKIITSGEGGFVTTNDERLYHQLKHLNRMAFDPNHTFLHKKLSYNFVMTNMQAAVVKAQIENIDEILAKRKQIGEWYNTKIGSLTLPRPEGSVYWMYDIQVPLEIDREEFMAKLAEKGIETRLFFKPMSMQPPYGGISYEHLNAYEWSKVGCYLPMHPALTKEDVDYISDCVINILGELSTST